jgi:serine/threonine-protein kinase
VFRAVDSERDRLVAVKLFTLDLPPERAHQLVGEFERIIAASLIHPALAAPIAAGLRGVSPYLVVEYFAAESLDLAIRQYGPAPAADAVRVAAQLAGALDFAAVVSIHHGTLHPRDVLLTPEETRVTGIGVASALEHVGVAVPVRRPYTAPERLAGGVRDRRAADIFSLAALMYELLWGRRITAIGAEAAELLTPIDDGDLLRLKGVFARALSEDPGARFGTALEFVEALKNACPGVTLAPPTIVEPAHGEMARPPLAAPTKDVAAAAIRRTDRAEPAVVSGPPAARADVGPPVPAAASPPRPDEMPRVLSDASAPRGDVGAPVPLDAPTPPPGVIPFVASGFSRTRGASPDAPVSADLDLRTAEEARYSDVEAAPAIVNAARLPFDSAAEEPRLGVADRSLTRSPDDTSLPPSLVPATETSSAPGRRLSGLPLVLTVSAGIALGFGGGYLLVRGPQRDRTATPPPPAPREFTESTVPDAKPDGRGASATTPEVQPPSRAERASAGLAGASGGGGKPDTAPSATATATGSARPDTARNAASPTARPELRSPNVTSPKAREQSEARAAPAFTGRLLVRSTPADATVFVDGREYGRTPVAVRDLAPGTHRVRLVRDGYSPSEQRVVITRARPAQSVTVTLPERRRSAPPASGSQVAAPSTPATTGQYTGGLIIESRPAGAKVFVDNRLAGTTPLLVDTARAGEHAIRLELDGYRRWTTQVRVIASERTRVTASLER